MRTSQRSQSLQILRTQTRARRERGADPCVALGHLLPCSPLGACRTLSCSAWLHPRAPLEHTVGSRLTSGKSVVAMHFLPTPLCYPTDPSLCFSQSFPLTRCWSQYETFIPHSDPPPCHSESSRMSKSSPLPSLEPRRKGEKRKEGREKFLERGHQNLLGIIKRNENVPS